MRPGPGVRLFKSVVETGLSAYSPKSIRAMQAIYGRENHKNLSAVLDQMHVAPNERHLFRGIGFGEIQAIRSSQRIGYGTDRVNGKDLELSNPHHILMNTSQLLHSASRDIRYASEYAKLGLMPGESCILMFNAPVVVDQQLHFKVDDQVYKKWDDEQNNLPTDMDTTPAKPSNAHELASRTDEVDVLVNTPALSAATDFRPTVEDIIQVVHLYVPGRILSFLPNISSEESEKVFDVDFNKKCQPRTWSLSILNTGNTNTYSEAEFQRLMTLAHSKGVCDPDERLLSIEDAEVAFKVMCEAHPRLDSYTPDHLFQTLASVPKDIPLGSTVVAEVLAERHEQFKQAHAELETSTKPGL